MIIPERISDLRQYVESLTHSMCSVQHTDARKFVLANELRTDIDHLDRGNPAACSGLGVPVLKFVRQHVGYRAVRDVNAILDAIEHDQEPFLSYSPLVKLLENECNQEEFDGFMGKLADLCDEVTAAFVLMNHYGFAMGEKLWSTQLEQHAVDLARRVLEYVLGALEESNATHMFLESTKIKDEVGSN